MANSQRRTSASLPPVAMNGLRSLRRHVATWDFRATGDDELSLTRGDILLVAERFDDGWMRGIRLSDLEVGYFPGDFVAIDTSPIYTLKDIVFPKDYVGDPKFAEYDPCRRSKIALEICTTEEIYLKKLHTLNEKFASPLSQNGIISAQDRGALFRHIQVLLNLSHFLLVHLQSRMEGWDEKQTLIGDIFLDMGHHMKAFISYASHHILGAQLILKLNNQEKFSMWLKKVECDWSLNSLLIEPIQRIPRYELLLKDLLKYTTKDHPDVAPLREALAFIQKIAQDCNESVKRAENELKLYSITKRFPNDDVNVIVSTIETTTKKNVQPEGGGRGFQRGSSRIRTSMRRLKRASGSNFRNSTPLSCQTFFEAEHQRVFVREGPLMKTKSDFSDPSERYLFLCSDVLLIAQPTSRSHKRFRLRERVMLRHAWVTDTLPTKDETIPERGFIVGTPLRVYHFLAASGGEKTSWFRDLHSHIFIHKKLFNKLLSHLTIPDEVYHYAQTKARVSYVGILNDELSFRAGDGVWVMGYKSGEEQKWQAGLYISQEAFNPSPEWYFGSQNGSFGWFPAQCLFGAESRPLEPSPDELKPAEMSVVLGLKQRMRELTGREVPPLRETETVKVCMGEGNFKILHIPSHGCVNDIVMKYFRVQPDRSLHWSLIEQSVDGTVQRLLRADEDPSEVVNFWGKSKDQMRFVLKKTLTNNHTPSPPSHCLSVTVVS